MIKFFPSICWFVWKLALMLKDVCTSIRFQTVEKEVPENIFPTHAGKFSPTTSPFYRARLHRPIPKDIKTHLRPLLFHTLLTLLLFPPSFRVSTKFPVGCSPLFSVFTRFPHFLSLFLTKTKTTTHLQQVLPSRFLFCLALLTLCYLLSLYHWNCSCDFCFPKWCCLYLYLRWSLSLTFVISANFIIHFNTFSLWLSQLHPHFCLLTADASFSIPICHGNLSRLSLFCLSLWISNQSRWQHSASAMCALLSRSLHPPNPTF